MTDLPSAGDLLRAYGTPSKRSLGQHFLVDPSILGRIVEQSGVSKGDHVLEIGPGPGTLTRTLLAHGCIVTAVELDRDAVAFLLANLAHPSLTIHRGDALDLDIDALASEPTTVIANLPYNIATEIFFRIEAHRLIRAMTLMFQREVAQRIVADRGGKSYGPLALLSGIRWHTRLVFTLPPGAFLPPPKVHSAAIHFERRAEPRVSADLEPTLRALVRAAFQKRRKTIRNALAGKVTAAAIEAAGIELTSRPETLTFDAFKALAERAALPG